MKAKQKKKKHQGEGRLKCFIENKPVVSKHLDVCFPGKDNIYPKNIKNKKVFLSL